MTQQKHIINKQILEIRMPSSADTFAVQQELSALCRQQLKEVMDRLFDSHTNTDSNESIQIDRLTLDLGKVSLENFATVFDKKLQESFQNEVSQNLPTRPVGNQHLQQDAEEEKTPLRAVAFYLNNGIVPWWAQETSKTFVQQQIAQLLQKPPRKFIQLLQQLRWNPQQQQRFVHSTSEKQKVAALQLISGMTLEKLVPVLEKFQRRIQKNHPFSTHKIQTVFWEVAFQNIHKVTDYASFEQECIQYTELALGIQSKKPSNQRSVRDVYEIRTIVGRLKTKYPTNGPWKDFFKKVSEVISHPFLDQLPDPILKECLQLLKKVAASDKMDIRQKDPVIAIKPLARYLQGIQKQLQQISNTPRSITTEKLSSPFEDTDFIPVQNAGLILLWPFLERFFENLEVMSDKTFTDEAARHRAVCTLQYVCDENDSELFEGVLPLNKVLCGVDIDEVIPNIELSEEEKEIAEGLLTAVIGQGPHWKNLSIEGFRASYLCRPGSLRTRDGHWLLQVQRETHDITLEKLPWGFHTVKLPWMQEILVVEWL